MRVIRRHGPHADDVGIERKKLRAPAVKGNQDRWRRLLIGKALRLGDQIGRTKALGISVAWFSAFLSVAAGVIGTGLAIFLLLGSGKGATLRRLV